MKAKPSIVQAKLDQPPQRQARPGQEKSETKQTQEGRDGPSSSVPLHLAPHHSASHDRCACSLVDGPGNSRQERSALSRSCLGTNALHECQGMCFQVPQVFTCLGS